MTQTKILQVGRFFTNKDYLCIFSHVRPIRTNSGSWSPALVPMDGVGVLDLLALAHGIVLLRHGVCPLLLLVGDLDLLDCLLPGGLGLDGDCAVGALKVLLGGIYLALCLLIFEWRQKVDREGTACG